METSLKDITLPRPTAPSNLYVEVANSLRSLIVERKLRPGDRLPSERVLAQQLHVGRPVVRDALRILETLGLIGVSARQGSYVKQPDMTACIGAVVDSVARSQAAEVDWEENLRETRRILAAEEAGLAAQRATPEDRRAILEAVERLREVADDAATFAVGERDFLRAVAHAARNPILAGLANGLTGLGRNGVHSAPEDADARREALAQYERLAAQILAYPAQEIRRSPSEMRERSGNGYAPAA